MLISPSQHSPRGNPAQVRQVDALVELAGEVEGAGGINIEDVQRDEVARAAATFRPGTIRETHHERNYETTNLTYVDDYNAIVEVLNKYNEGGAKADCSIMKPAFREKATIFGVVKGNLAGRPIQGLYDTIDTAFRPSPEAKAAIVRVDIVGIAASARVDTDNISGFRFTDFFNLLKVGGKWTVISKIYHTHASA